MESNLCGICMAIRWLTGLSDWVMYVHTSGILEDTIQEQEELEHKGERMSATCLQVKSLQENGCRSSSKAFTTQQIHSVEQTALSSLMGNSPSDKSWRQREGSNQDINAETNNLPNQRWTIEMCNRVGRGQNFLEESQGSCLGFGYSHIAQLQLPLWNWRNGGGVWASWLYLWNTLPCNHQFKLMLRFTVHFLLVMIGEEDYLIMGIYCDQRGKYESDTTFLGISGTFCFCSKQMNFGPFPARFWRQGTHLTVFCNCCHLQNGVKIPQIEWA